MKNKNLELKMAWNFLNWIMHGKHDDTSSYNGKHRGQAEQIGNLLSSVLICCTETSYIRYSQRCPTDFLKLEVWIEAKIINEDFRDTFRNGESAFSGISSNINPPTDVCHSGPHTKPIIFAMIRNQVAFKILNSDGEDGNQ